MNINKLFSHGLPLILGGSILVSTASAAEDGAPSLTPKRDPVPIAVDGHDAKITYNEDMSIKARRREVLRYLYEQDQLEELGELVKKRSRNKAIESQMEEITPLAPSELVERRKKIKEYEVAKNKPLKPAQLSIKTISYDVNSDQPITLNVMPGYASSVVFFDESGEPWPVGDDNVIGSSDAYSALVVSENKNTVVFEIKKPFAESNALLNLKGIPSPIIIRLSGSTSKVNARLSVRIPMPGPNQPKVISGSIYKDEVNGDILSFLNGSNISEGKRFKLAGIPGEAFVKEDKLYVRTMATLISPPGNQVRSPTGMWVYELPLVRHLLFSHNGEMRKVQIDPSRVAHINHQKSIFLDNE